MNKGDKVKKISEYYEFEGTVVAVFEKLSKQTCVVVENNDGVLCIFHPSQLEITNYTQDSVRLRMQYVDIKKACDIDARGCEYCKGKGCQICLCL